ncbi:MAG: O-antigen ligase family protein [Candidatus Magasanikbacteria bacterium]|nr:O-antigen ligase family protein [Candidatus Magasanikbacteria bacterium]
MKQNIVKAMKFLIYATFFVPLLVFPASFIFPFIVPKILMFRSLVELMIAGYILLLIINWQEFKPKFTLLNVALAAFFASFTISTFSGVDPYHSFWDNHERMLGLFTIFHYIAYYFICSSVFKTWDDWKKALKVFLTGGTLVMLIALFQVVKPDFLLNQGSDRVIATLGNAIYVGGYGLFLIFVSFLLFIKETNKVWKWLEPAAGVLALLGMFFSGTRGSMLGLVAGMGVAILGYIIVLKDFPKTRKILAGVAVAGVAVIALLYAFRESSFVQKIPAVNRTILTSFESVKNSPRWIAWESAVASWKEKPVFGWGPNNFFYAFNKYYQSKSLRFGYGETWFDNAHNILVNTLAVQGLVGLVSYLFIFVAGVVALTMARVKKMMDPHVVVMGISFLAAHLVQNVTVFENPTSYLYFMFWLAMIGGLSAKAMESNLAPAASKLVAAPDKRMKMGGVSTASVAALLLIFIFNIQPARANMKTLEALKYLSYQPEAGIELMKAALAFNSPHIDDIRSDLTRTVSSALGSENSKLSKEKSLEAFNIVFEAMKENVILHPYDIRNYLTLAQLSQVGYTLTGDTKYIGDYGNNLEIALTYSPKRQQVIYNLANFYLQIGKTDEAIKAIEGTINDDPKVGESYWRLAYIYKLIGKMDKAKEVLDLAEKNGVVFNQPEQAVIAQILSAPVTTKVDAK